MLRISWHAPWMEVASADNATVANKCHCYLEILSPNVNLVQWNIVATGVLFSLLSSPTQLVQKNACVHCEVILEALNVSRTAPMPHVNMPGTVRRLPFRRQAQGLKVYREICTGIENRWITPIRMPCTLVTDPRIRSICSNRNSGIRSQQLKPMMMPMKLM